MGGVRAGSGLTCSTDKTNFYCDDLSSTSNAAPPPKAVAQLIGATLLLIGVNLAIVIVVFLPPKRKFVEGIVVFVGDPPATRESTSVAAGSCPAAVEFNWASQALLLSTNSGRAELREAKTQVGRGIRTSGLRDVVVRVVPPLPASLRPVNSVDPSRGQLTVIDCGFVPRFLALGTNESLRCVNSNSTPKSLIAVSGQTNVVVTWTPTLSGESKTLQFAREEFFVRLQSVDNPALHGVVAVLGHPYFATVDGDGVFRLPGGLPDEEFTLEAIHPTLGRRAIRVQPRRPAGPLVIRFGAE